MSNSERHVVSRMTRVHVFRIRVYRLVKIVTVAVLTAVFYHLTIRHRVGGDEEEMRHAAWSLLVYGHSTRRRVCLMVPKHFLKLTVRLITGNEW